MTCCSFIKSQVFIVMLEHSEYHELTRAHAKDGALPPVLGHTTGQEYHVRAREHDRVRAVTGNTGGQSALLLPPWMLPRVCCSSFVCHHGLMHERDAFGLQHVQGQVAGRHLWHVALEGGWPHPQKVSAIFIMEKWSKASKFGRDQHSPLVNSSHEKCSSALTNIHTYELVF